MGYKVKTFGMEIRPLKTMQELSALDGSVTVQLFSAFKREGIPESQGVIDRWLEIPPVAA